MKPVHVLARTPGAVEANVPTVEWETMCRDRRDWVMVHYVPRRPTSRWESKRRKRPFAVARCRHNRVGWTDFSFHATFAAAFKAANRLAAGK